MNFVQQKVKEMVKQKFLEEGIISDDLIPGADGKLAKFAEKCEKFIDKTIKEAGELADEGEELMKVDLTQNTSVGERNRILLSLVGFMRKLRNGLAVSTTALRKTLG